MPLVIGCLDWLGLEAGLRPEVRLWTKPGDGVGGAATETVGSLWWGGEQTATPGTPFGVGGWVGVGGKLAG